MNTELIARLEAAEVGARELDAMIWDIEDDRPRWSVGDDFPIYKQAPEDNVAFEGPPSYTTSIDSALALASRVITNLGPIDLTIMGSAEVSIHSNDPCDNPLASAFGKSPALAICIAILRALDAQEQK